MYATAADMIAAFGEDEVVACTDRIGEHVVDMLVLETALQSASSEADSYLARRYALPLTLTPIPAALTSVVCDIARYRLTGGVASETDPIRDRYKLACDWLRRLADGDIDLPGMLASPDGQVPQFAPGRRIFAARADEEGDDD